ncbi:MAG: hypothetical protein EOO93_29905 [Pedobacter sp.]|nr:MAG: hypothetical protein EOO93_29905 [Pedobacter sp.]
MKKADYLCRNSINMKSRHSFSLIILTLSLFLISWGYTGHRTIGKLTENYLTPTAKKAVQDLLGDESIADACTWADEARKFPELILVVY